MDSLELLATSQQIQKPGKEQQFCNFKQLWLSLAVSTALKPAEDGEYSENPTTFGHAIPLMMAMTHKQSEV